MQISRLFGIVYILLNRRHTTAKMLAERFEVSVRTIYRDIDALSLAGVPVYSMQGACGGIFINDAYILNKSILSDEDQAAILLALQSLTVSGNPDGNQLLGRLGNLFNKESADWIDVDFSRWGGHRDRETLSLVKDAILRQRVLSFDYYGGSGEHSERSVCPMRLLFKSSAWYVQAFCLAREAYRTFKLVRMANACLQADTFSRKNLPAPPRVDETTDEPPPLSNPILLQFSPELAWRVMDEFDPQTIRHNEDGTLTVRCCFPEDAWLYGYILSFGNGCEVVSPSSLRESLYGMLLEIAKKYK